MVLVLRMSANECVRLESLVQVFGSCTAAESLMCSMLTTATGRPAGPDQAQAGRVVQGQAGQHPRAAEHAAHGAVGGLRVEDARPDRPGGGQQGAPLVITAHEQCVLPRWYLAPDTALYGTVVQTVSASPYACNLGYSALPLPDNGML